MAELNLKANIDRPDDFYEALLNAHDGMSKTQSDAFNARLILILANHIGDRDVLNTALTKAAK